MRSYLLVLPMAFVLSACAEAPENISAAQIPDSTYANANCSSLMKSEVQNTQLLHALSADQKKAQSGDAWGVFLLGLPISSMSGADKETEIALTKGKIDAIRRQQAAKGCSGAPEEALRPPSGTSQEAPEENNQSESGRHSMAG